jgi:hypothetical protein
MMLNYRDHPVAWAMLMYELDDASEHLESLINQMQVAGAIDEEDFAVQLGHVFAHLNRAWNGRDDETLADQTQEEHELRSRFPPDLHPGG